VDDVAALVRLAAELSREPSTIAPHTRAFFEANKTLFTKVKAEG
jgi:hypothetical protein